MFSFVTTSNMSFLHSIQQYNMHYLKQDLKIWIRIAFSWRTEIYDANTSLSIEHKHTFFNEHNSINKYSVDDYTKMLDFVIDNIFVQFQQTVRIPICTKCAPLPADLFPNSYNNARFSDFLHFKYSNELEIKDVINSYLDLYLELM